MPYYTMGFVEAAAIPIAVLVFTAGLFFYRRRPTRRQLGGALVLTAAVVLLWEVVGNADMIYLSWQARHLCTTESGLHVYRTARTDGFLGDSAIDHWSAYGFEYVEKIKPRRDGKPPVVRYVMADGEITWERFPTLRSRYQYSGLRMRLAGYQVERRQRAVEDRTNGELLGELVSFAVYPGWFDRQLLALLPGTWRPWTCGEAAPAGAGSYDRFRNLRLYSHIDLIEATLKPH
ncbi:MAG: hypothetical protein WD928_13000 [Gammaproteobacteria bacterium]